MMPPMPRFHAAVIYGGILRRHDAALPYAAPPLMLFSHDGV